MATLHDVAAKAGLSIVTISHYMNGATVRKNNKIKIENAIKELNFQLNHVAKSLRTNKTMTIGILLPTFDSRFYPPLISRLERKLFDNGYNVLLCDYDNNEKIENQKFNFLISRQVDQIITVPMGLSLATLESAEQKKVPVIFFDHLLKDSDTVSVITDNFDVSYQATKLLLEKGRRNILFITSHSTAYSMSERVNGCLQCIKDFNLDDVAYEIIETGGGSTDAYNKTLQALNFKWDAILALSSNNMLGAAMAVSEKSLKVPEDISFVGFDNSQISKIFNPSLSYICQPTDAIADRLLDLVLFNAGRLNGFQKDDNNILLEKRQVVKSIIKVTNSI